MDMAKHMLSMAFEQADWGELKEFASDLYTWAAEQGMWTLFDLLDDPELLPMKHEEPIPVWELERARMRLKEIIRDCVDFTEEKCIEFLTWYTQDLGGSL